MRADHSLTDSDTDSDTGRAPGPGPVIAAVTFDERGRQCLRQALQRAAHTGQTVVALHIVHESERSIGLYRRHDRGEVLRPNSEVARRLLAGLCAEVVAEQSAGPAAALRELVVDGVPGRRIPELARLLDAGLIVVGGRHHRSLPERLFGSDVTAAVLRRAPVAVLVVDADGNPLDVARGRGRNRSLPPAVETH